MSRLVTLLSGLAGLLIWNGAGAAQQYVISTYVGGATPPFQPGPAVQMEIGQALGPGTDAVGNVYFTSPQLNSVFKLDPTGVLTRIAGSSTLGYAGDGGPASSGLLNLGGYYSVSGAVVDAAGYVFLADTFNNRIRRISPNGIITTVAGTGTSGFSGDGGPANAAQLNLPVGLALDGNGNLFIADGRNYRIRKVSAAGIITTLAGTGTLGFSGDGGPAIDASVYGYGLAADGAGNVFIADPGSNRVRRISPNGIITTVVGGGALVGASGGPATDVQLVSPHCVAVDAGADLFVCDGNTVRKVSRGIITTVAGGGAATGDGVQATQAGINQPLGLAVDGAGNLFIADSDRLRKVAPTGIITTVAGTGTFSLQPRLGDGGPASLASLSYPQAVAVDQAGNLFVADTSYSRIRKVLASGTVTTVAGTGVFGFSGDGGQATQAQLNQPCGLALDGAGDLFIADCGNSRIRMVSSSGIITTVAGNGIFGFSGDGGPAIQAQLNPLDDGDGTLAGGIAINAAGELFIADFMNNRIRKVSLDGTISTVAGTGTYGFTGDGAQAARAQLALPVALAVDSAGDLFIGGACSVRKVETNGIITTVAGNGCSFEGSDNGDGGPARSARLSYATGLAVDATGDLFIADGGWTFAVNGSDGPCCVNRIRKVSPDGVISTVSGDGAFGFSGDGGAAVIAELNEPSSVAVDGMGNLYVADYINRVVRILRPTGQSVLIGAVVDAASERADAVSPGKIVVLYGAGLGPAQLVQNQPANGLYGTTLAGTTVSFSGIPAPILYTSATQAAAVVPYGVAGTQTHATVSYQGQTSSVFTVNLVQSAPSLFTLNQAGWGKSAAINVVDGTVNSALNPVKVGDYISLWATGEGQTSPAGVDGKVGSSAPPHPALPWSVTVGGISVPVQYAGGAPGQVAGLMQVNVQIPHGVQPGGYVPVVLQVGTSSTTAGAVWITVGQ